MQFLKALDVLEANRIDDKITHNNGDNGTNQSSTSSSSSVAPTFVATLSAGNISAHNAVVAATTSTAPGGGGGNPRSVAAAELITPARQRLDQAVARLTAEEVLFDGALLAECDDYYLAAALLLEEVQIYLNCCGFEVALFL